MMSHHDLLLSLAILAFVTSVLLVFNLLAWRQNRRIIARLASRECAPAPAADSPYQMTDIPTSLLVTTLSRLERRIMQLEQGLKDRPAPLTSQPAASVVPDPATDTRYARAQQLIQDAHSAEQVAQGSGMTLYEAELLLRLHRQPPTNLNGDA